MADADNSPVFIVGSYRSGTSIFCWCLGQHPNLVNLPETNWLSRLGIDLNNLYRLATVNGEVSHLSQIGLSQDEFYRLFGEGVQHVMRAANLLLLEKQPRGELRRRRSADDPKRRWVDATPENVHYLYSLGKLFPEARFIHLLRSPHDVARSLMKFSRTGARDYEHDEAYKTWMRLTREALEGERALGTRRMLRLRYEDFVGMPEQAFRRALEFLGEEYSSDCLQPLAKKINSSEVTPESVPVDDSTPVAVEAEQLYREALTAAEPSEGGDAETYLAMQTRFLERCRFMQAAEQASELAAQQQPPRRGVGERIRSLWSGRA